MLKYGNELDKYLGLCLQVILDLITLLGNQDTSSLGCKQSKRNEDKANNQKGLIGRCHNQFFIFLILLTILRVPKWKISLRMKTWKKLLRICDVLWSKHGPSWWRYNSCRCVAHGLRYWPKQLGSHSFPHKEGVLVVYFSTLLYFVARIVIRMFQSILY